MEFLSLQERYEMADISGPNQLLLKRLFLSCDYFPKSRTENFLIAYASKPNNPRILRFLIKLANQLQIEISGILSQSLIEAVNKQRTSNVCAILEESKNVAKTFDLRSALNLTGLLDKEEIVQTSSPNVDIMLLLRSVV